MIEAGSSSSISRRDNSCVGSGRGSSYNMGGVVAAEVEVKTRAVVVVVVVSRG